MPLGEPNSQDRDPQASEARRFTGRRTLGMSEQVGGTVRYAGTSPSQIIGGSEIPWWDAIIVVEYPSPAAFLDMVTNEEYLKIQDHRANALDRGDLIATSTWTMAD